MIENIVEGMKAVQVFDILNRLIDEHNQLMNALGGALVDGKLDYKALVNKPAINGIELSGDVNPADLVMGVDDAVLEKVNSVSRQLQDYQTERNGYVQRLGQLESGRTADLQRISTLEGEKTARESDLVAYKATINALAISVSERMGEVESRESTRNTTLRQNIAEFQQQVSEVRSGLASKADASVVPTTKQWQVLKADMDAKTTAAQNAKTAAENAMADKASDTQFKEVADRVIKLINRVNMVADAVVLLENNGCTFGRQTMHDASGGACLSNISNTFTFDVN